MYLNQFSSSEIDSFIGVLSWVIKTHSEALISLTSEIAPFLETGVRIDKENEAVYFPTSSNFDFYDADVDSLLYRTLFIGLSYENRMSFDRVKKGTKVSIDKMKDIKDKTVELMKAYASTKEALEAIQKVTRPFDKEEHHFAILRQNEDVKNVNKLKKFEKAAKDYIKEIQKVDWDRFSRIDPNIWKEKASKHNIDVANRELDNQLYQSPILSLYPLNLHTDIERRLAAFFISLERIEESYEKCLNLFEKCKEASGFLRGPPSELKNEAVEALEQFCINYGGLCYLDYYASSTLISIKKDADYGIQSIRPHKYSLADIDKFMSKPRSDGTVDHSEEIINQLHYLVHAKNWNNPE